jgi:hypothetical protein
MISEQAGKDKVCILGISYLPLRQFKPNAKAPTTAGGKYRVIYDFDAKEENEISIKAGELITVTDKR